jgi:GNAT superfamily N-acetyltransferase
VYRSLGEGRLTTGERLDLGVVEAPDLDWAARLTAFLSHKPPDFDYHIEASLAGPLDGLSTRFYVGTVDGQVVTNVMIVGARGFGILGHVFTDPAWRRRGAYRQLMERQMGDVRALGYRAMTLVTGYDSHAYWVYHSFGFRSIEEGSGSMRWLADPTAELLAPGPTSAHPTLWDDWAAYEYATLEPVGADEALPRSPLLSVRARGHVEGAFPTFQLQVRRWPDAQSRMLVLESGAVVGWCHVAPAPVVLGDAWLLDLHVLPGFESDLGRLIEGVSWPDGPVAFFADTRREEYLACLRTAGFAETAALPGFVARPDGRRALGLWAR